MLGNDNDGVDLFVPVGEPNICCDTSSSLARSSPGAPAIQVEIRPLKHSPLILTNYTSDTAITSVATVSSFQACLS
jgi:hypothetical protein